MLATACKQQSERGARPGVRALLAFIVVVIGCLAGIAGAEEPKLQAHQVPEEKRAAIEAWRATLPPEVRTVWDERTGQLLLLAPMQVHADFLRLLTDATPSVGDASGIRLRGIEPDELHRRIESLARRPLPATWDGERRTLSFPATLGEGPGVEFRIDATTGDVAIEGSAEAVTAWREVVVAIDQSITMPAGEAPTVRVVSTPGAPTGRVKNALQALQVADTQPAGGAEPGEAPAARARVAEDESILGPVRLEFVEGLDVIVLRGDQEDVDRVLRIIDQIEDLSAETTPLIEVRRLRHIDAGSLAELLTGVYDTALGPRVGGLSITGLAKPNALLLVGRAENVRLAMGLVDQLDQPVEPTNRFEVYQLRHASAADVKSLVDDYFEQQQGDSDDESASLLRSRAFVVADYRSNTLIVNAAPRDQVEVKALVERLDESRGQAVDEVRVFPLRNSIAEELAEVLERAISPEEAVEDDNAAPRAAALRLGTGAGDPAALESGVLTGVRVSPDTRANALVVTAPAGSMGLIAALIEQLDRTPDAAAELKVFTVANGDAEALAEMLRSLFGSEDDSDDPGGYGSNTLSPLNVTTDPRTNSIVVAGTTEDLAVVEAILLRLDDAEVGSRQTNVYRLRNAEAANVAEVLNEWLENEREAEDDSELSFSPRELIEREVVIVAEPATNSLIISATPRYEAEMQRLVAELDERPPMVMIQVLIAEVGLNNTDEFGVELGLQDSLLFDRSLLSDTQFITTTTNEQSAGGATITTETQEIISSELTPGFNFNNANLGNNGSTNALATAGNVATQALSSFALGRVNSELNFGGFVFSASSSNVSFLLRALQENRRLEVLSRPQIMTLDGQTGTAQVGAQVPQIIGVNQTQFGQTNNIEYKDVGIILEVTPRVSPDGQVVMQVAAEKSQVGEEEEGIAISISNTGEVIRAPQIDTTRADTVVSANSGQTVVLSGLLTKRTFDVHRRVPLLADIPLVGDLFRYDGVEETRTELLIIMTPRIVRTELDAEMIKQVESSRMSWVLSDVIDMHGPAGLRTRGDDWSEAETCYPTHVPTEIVPGQPIESAAPMLMHPELSATSESGAISPASYDRPAAPRLLPPTGN